MEWVLAAVSRNWTPPAVLAAISRNWTGPAVSGPKPALVRARALLVRVVSKLSIAAILIGLAAARGECAESALSTAFGVGLPSNWKFWLVVFSFPGAALLLVLVVRWRERRQQRSRPEADERR